MRKFYKHCKKTSSEELYTILKNSLLHINIDGAYTHISKALGTKSIVLFGPTCAKYLGYPENINSTSSLCRDCYHFLDNTLWGKCLLGYEKISRYGSISPEFVANKVCFDNINNVKYLSLYFKIRRLSMKYNFDKIVKIKNTNSIKYDSAKEYGMPDGLFPMWLADMDFKVMPEITKALEKSAKHAIFGYTTTNQEYFKPIQKWFNSHFNFNIKFEWLVNTPGVVFAIAMTIRALTKVGDAIIIQTPVYAPFSNVIFSNNRKLITNSLIYKNGEYTIDFKDFEEKITKNKVKMFILCSPHNPVGKVWKKEDLIKLGNICLKHNVIVVADEIHCDFAYKGYNHTVFASLKKDFLMNVIMCTSGGKTFNFAGFQIANIFIANKSFKEKVVLEIAKTGYDGLSNAGVVTCQVAYKYGDKWLKELKDYIYNNLSYIRNFLKTKIPKLKLVEPEGTYLIWIDCTKLNINEKTLKNILENKAKLWVAMGSSFGVEGTNFIRIAIATPFINIKTVFNNLFRALKSEKLI